MGHNFETLFSHYTIGHTKSTAGHSEFDVVFADDGEEWEEDDEIKNNEVSKKGLLILILVSVEY